MKKIVIITLLGCVPLMLNCAVMAPVSKTSGTIIVPAEGSIPGVPPEIESSDYWIRQSAYPDDVIMTPEEIGEFNRNNPLNGKYLLDITEMPESSEGENIRDYLAQSARYLAGATFYVTGDIPLEQSERANIIALMDTVGIPEAITLRYGVILSRTMGREWPTPIPLMKEINDNEFDYGVTAELDTGTPVALLHTSKDGRWSFVQSPWFMCWIPSDAVAYGSMETVREFVHCVSPLVAVGHRVSVFGKPDDLTTVTSIQMGSYLPLKTAGSEFFEVLVPGRNKNGELEPHVGYIRRSSDISIGFLPYTLRNVYRQCYVLYGRRYGWGGMFEERDCSRYTMDIFRCFDIRLPRNSTSQAQSSKAVMTLHGMDRETKSEVLRTLPGGISLLRMPGHIMIYLGEFEGKPYAISAFWAWRTPSDDGADIVHRAARVAVTDLMLGEGSEKGPYLERLTDIAILGNYEIREQ